MGWSSGIELLDTTSMCRIVTVPCCDDRAVGVHVVDRAEQGRPQIAGFHRPLFAWFDWHCLALIPDLVCGFLTVVEFLQFLPAGTGQAVLRICPIAGGRSSHGIDMICFTVVGFVRQRSRWSLIPYFASTVSHVPKYTRRDDNPLRPQLAARCEERHAVLRLWHCLQRQLARRPWIPSVTGVSSGRGLT